MTPRSKPKQRQARPPDPAPGERPAEKRPGTAQGSHEMTVELKRLREDAAVLRKVLTDMQRAASEEQIIASERQATQRRMDRERFRDRR